MNTKFLAKSHYKKYLWLMIKFHHKKMWQKFIFNKKINFILFLIVLNCYLKNMNDHSAIVMPQC